jgi:ketosteroid isomerase-like protein
MNQPLDDNLALEVIHRLHDAQNRHDLQAFLSCFTPDYESVQPIHPDRGYAGLNQVKKNWSALFAAYPNFRSQLLDSISTGDTVWGEWHWQGSNPNGTSLDWRGVIIFQIRDGKIASGRTYMEPIQQEGEGIDAVIKDMTTGKGLEG